MQQKQPIEAKNAASGAKVDLREFEKQALGFHGYLAPGLVLGGFMVAELMRRLPQDRLHDALCETRHCLPDAVQLLTPCTIGNGWLKVLDLGRWALTLYDKQTLEGLRISMDAARLAPWPHLSAWFTKAIPKREQDTAALLDEIRAAGAGVCKVEPVRVSPPPPRQARAFVLCPVCGEHYPAAQGESCLACQGQTPYEKTEPAPHAPPLKSVPLKQAVGQRALCDMTRIEPGVFKGPELRKGQLITAGDVCRLEKMGRGRVYTEECALKSGEWVHENEAALAFAQAMAGEGVTFAGPPSEGKLTLRAARDGLFTLDAARLTAFNLASGVMCATRKGGRVVKKGDELAGTRALPLYLARPDFERALAALAGEPLLKVLELKKPPVGLLITGAEVADGLIQDRFAPVIRAKIEPYGLEIRRLTVAPDDPEAIAREALAMEAAGAGLIITTAGLSVDPDDVTRQGLDQAGASELAFGAPILPGAMTLVGRLGRAELIGVPACALFHHTTSLDLVLPLVLAGLRPSRRELAAMAEGGLCLGCQTCRFPACPFGR